MERSVAHLVPIVYVDLGFVDEKLGGLVAADLHGLHERGVTHLVWLVEERDHLGGVWFQFFDEGVKTQRDGHVLHLLLI